MSDRKSELEMMFELWNPIGFHYEIGPDRDGLDCIEIRYYDGDETVSTCRMTFSKDDALLLYQALGKLLRQ